MAANTPVSAQAAVIAKHITGDTNTKIAEDLGLHRNTVARILNDSEIVRLGEETKSELISGTLGAARRIVKDSKRNTDVAFEYLDRMGILTKKEAGATTNVAVGVNFDGMPGLK